MWGDRSWCEKGTGHREGGLLESLWGGNECGEDRRKNGISWGGEKGKGRMGNENRLKMLLNK
jgi:hypothetical protein